MILNFGKPLRHEYDHYMSLNQISKIPHYLYWLITCKFFFDFFSEATTEMCSEKWLFRNDHNSLEIYLNRCSHLFIYYIIYLNSIKFYPNLLKILSYT